MKRVLSIDPGITTGIACYSEEGILELSITVTNWRVRNNGFLNKLVSMTRPEIVLIEDIPSHAPDRFMAVYHEELVKWFRIAGYFCLVLKPSQWKGLVQRVEIPGQHARDAATMAFWYINQQGVRK